LRGLWDFCYRYRIDIAFELFFAVVVGVFFEFLRVDSPLRAAVRHLKNKLAEQSAARRRTRIAQTELYRDRVQEYLTSDKALYLATLQFVLGILLFICVAAGVFLLGSLTIIPKQFELLALLPITVATIMAVYGIHMTFWDTPAKISDVIAKLNGEIAELQAKLDARTQ
jgi:hypothetical protein